MNFLDLVGTPVPKIADFGLSRLFSELSHGFKVDVLMLKRRGYMSPEYINRGLVSTKSDIFSLGVIIIEKVTGCRDYPDDTGTPSKEFVEMVLHNWSQRKRIKDLFGVSPEVDYQQIRRCIQIGLDCVKTDRFKRPTISKIIKALHSPESADSSNIKGVHGPQSGKRDRNCGETSWMERPAKKYTPDFSMSLSAAFRSGASAMRIQYAFKNHNKRKMKTAAARIQSHFRTWQIRRNFMNMRRQAIKIQAAYRGHQVRRQYHKAIGVVEKAILRWKKKRKSLHGIATGMPVEMTTDAEAANTAEEDYYQVGRQQAEDRFYRSVVRAQALFRSHQAQEYRRMKVAHEKAKVRISPLCLADTD